MEIKFNFLGKEHKARFTKNTYANNGNLYVGVVTWDEEFEAWMPWGDLTVNLVRSSLEPNEAFLDTNNCAPEIITELKRKGCIKDTGLEMPSGFCMYPLVEFSEEFLKEIESEGDEDEEK